MTELVELYSIRLQGDENDPADIRAGEIEGVVMAHDLDWFQLYKWPEESKDEGEGEGKGGYNSLLPDGTFTLCLTGPTRCIDGDGNWCVKLALRDKNQKLVYGRGYYRTTTSNCEKYYDQPVTAVIRGKDGYAIMHYMWFKRAVQATVEVSLVDESSNSSYYGHIRAYPDIEYDNLYQKKYFRLTLFHASPQKPSKIQLSRPAVVVPMDWKIIIEAELFDSTTKSEVANGSVFFYGQTCGKSSKRIGGIEVKISWCHDPLRLLRHSDKP